MFFLVSTQGISFWVTGMSDWFIHVPFIGVTVITWIRTSAQQFASDSLCSQTISSPSCSCRTCGRTNVDFPSGLTVMEVFSLFFLSYFPFFLLFFRKIIFERPCGQQRSSATGWLWQDAVQGSFSFFLSFSILFPFLYHDRTVSRRSRMLIHSDTSD